jgi:autotransporter-associated beta strand protein
MNRGGQAFTGGLTVGGGRLQALGGGWATSFFGNASPRSITVQSNATLETTTHSLGGLGGSFYQPVITLNEGATWQLNAEQYLSGGNLVLKGATVSILANDLRIQGGTVVVNPSTVPTLINGGGSITLHGDTTFNVGNGSPATDATISVPIGNSGNRAVIKSGTGTLALTEPCSFYGPMTVSAGTLALRGGKDTLSQSMNASISAGAILDLSNNDQTLASLTGAGNVQLGYGTLTVTLSSTQTYGGVISGSPVGVPPGSGNTEESPNPGGFTKSGTGKLILTGSQTYTGDTIISSGVLALSGGGLMAYSSNILVAGTLDVTARTGGSMGVANYQTLRGNGTVLGTISAGTGSKLAPGDSVGTLTTGSQVWSGGAVLECEFTHATSPGSWDRLIINGSLNVSSSSANRFVIRLVSPGGPLAGFNPSTAYSWVIATTTDGIFNLAPDKLAVDASGLGVNLAGGRFSVLSQGNNLVLMFSPYVPTVITGFTMANGAFSLSGTGMVSQLYILQAATNLTSPVVWTPLATNAADPVGNFSFVDATATNSASRFYRVTLP